MGATMARRIASAGSLLALAAGALLIPTSTASAAERDGVCDAGEVCFYYNIDCRLQWVHPQLWGKSTQLL